MKQFLIIGNMNAVNYLCPLIKEDNLWIGFNHCNNFIQPNGEIKKFGNICWFTNLEHYKHNRPLDLYKTYSNEEYPKYDNYDAINVNKTAEIPMDYDGVMGVPITFLEKLNHNQFEIVKLKDIFIENQKPIAVAKHAKLDGKEKFARLFIRRKENTV